MVVNRRIWWVWWAWCASSSLRLGCWYSARNPRSGGRWQGTASAPGWTADRASLCRSIWHWMPWHRIISTMRHPTPWQSLPSSAPSPHRNSDQLILSRRRISSMNWRILRAITTPICWRMFVGHIILVPNCWWSWRWDDLGERDLMVLLHVVFLSY